MNESTRQKKVARVIQKELGDIFQKNARGIAGNAFVTITEVSITPDLSLARVYVSIMLADNKPEIVEKINQKKSEIRGKLGNKIGQVMRIVPDLEFLLDDLQEEALRMDALIDSLNIPPADEEEKDSE